MEGHKERFAVLKALGIRVIEVNAWEAGATYLHHHQALIVDADLGPEDMERATCNVLGMATRARPRHR